MASVPPIPMPFNSVRPASNKERRNPENSRSDAAVACKRPRHCSARNPSMIAMSQGESILLSSAGDVIVSRCRNSPYPGIGGNNVRPYDWKDEMTVLCCDANLDELQAQIDETAICSPWKMAAHNGNFKGGLLGGSPTEVVTPLHHSDGLRGGGLFREQERLSPDTTVSDEAKKAFRSPPLRGVEFDEYSIVPIRSFDYSHFTEGGNDMIPAPKPGNTTSTTTPEAIIAVKEKPEVSLTSVPFLHGVPTFLSSMHQVRVRQVSAHPLGAHVLCISDAGLLYSYGLNDYGQLGIGVKTPTTGFHRGFITTPTIVTPLVENGGKAIACAAGVSHSLVVVVTEERRLVKSYSLSNLSRQRSSSSSQDSSKSGEPIVHHQLYGFGRNDCLKIGLVSPKLAPRGSKDEMDYVPLPRRVALRCRVLPDDDLNSMPPQGIFAVAASVDHSAALVNRGSGDVELYTWGNATYGALGLPRPTPGLENVNASPTVRIVPVPSFAPSLSKTASRDARSSSLLLREEGEFPARLSLGKRCTFVATSLGRCFSFGQSDDGMLGLGRCITETHEPTEIALPREYRSEEFVSVSAGAHHVVAVMKSGAVFTWGLESVASQGSSSTSSAKDDISWSPRKVNFSKTANGSATSLRIVDATAGPDCSMFVSESGKVLASGKASGRLGLGEVHADVDTPKHLFGGLRLWKSVGKAFNGDKLKLPVPGKVELKRGLTIG